MLELQSEIMSENEELKSAVSRYQEQEKTDKNRILQLEREAAIFTSQVADLSLIHISEPTRLA